MFPFFIIKDDVFRKIAAFFLGVVIIVLILSCKGLHVLVDIFFF